MAALVGERGGRWLVSGLGWSAITLIYEGRGGAAVETLQLPDNAVVDQRLKRIDVLLVRHVLVALYQHDCVKRVHGGILWVGLEWTRLWPR